MLEKRINDQMKQALKNGDKVTLLVLRLAVSELKNKKIAERTQDLAEDKVMAVIQKMVKRYKDSIEQFGKGGRQDLVEKETAEMKVLEKLLPEQMNPQELERLVLDAIEETGSTSVKDMGKVMPIVTSRAKGRADGKTISLLVKEKLSS